MNSKQSITYRNFTMELFTNFFLVVALFIFLVKLSYNSNKKKLSPGPPALPIIGHFHLVRDPLNISILSSKYGPVMFLKLGCRSVVVVSSPSGFEECFSKNDIVLANRPKFLSAGHELTYKTSFSIAPYGPVWRSTRKVAMVQLLSSHSLQKSACIREEVTRSLLRYIFKSSRNGGSVIDLNYVTFCFTSNVMMKMIAGKWCVAEEDVGTEVGRENVKKFKDKFFTTVAMNVYDFFPVLKWFRYKGIKKNFGLLRKKRDDFLQGIIDDIRHNNDDSNPIKKEHRISMIESVLSLQQSESDFYTDDLIKSLTQNLFVAGTETTSIPIEWAMSLLLAHPEKLHKLRTEIDNIVGQSHLLDESDVPNLPYLKCVINETLRMYPALPVLVPHYSSEACEILGYKISEGTVVLADAWAIHRDPKLWEDPNKFNPERFEVVDKEENKFVPFGMGRRACPGASLAMKSISLILGTLVQCFQWEKIGTDEVNMDFNYKITMQKARPLEVMCTPRKELNGVMCHI